MNHKNVLIIRSNSIDPDSRVEKETLSLVNAGYNVTLLGWDRNSNYKIKKEIKSLGKENIQIFRYGILATFGGGIKKNLFPLLKSQIQIFKYIIKHRKKIDIIHACDFDTAFSVYFANLIVGKKMVYDIFDYYIDSFRVPAMFNNIIEKTDIRIINKSDSVIICSEQRKEQISKSNPKKLYIIHNSPPNLEEKIMPLNLNQNKFKIVYVGILGENRFLKEICEFMVDNPEYELHIGGFGEFEDYLRKKAQDNENIFFYGKLAYKDTLVLEKSCDALIAMYDPMIKNHYYAAPNKFYESLMLGKPIIMAKGTGMSNVIKKNGFGIIVNYNRESFDTDINKIKDFNNLEVSKRMKKKFYDEYSWEIMEKRLFDLYSTI